MKPQEQVLWQKMQAFQLDEPGVSFNFSARLARENGWSKNYTLRVIEEYKRFIFMCCITETGVTPSDAVDQAWHLHLTFTKSYWVDLCQTTLQKEIHHNPTKGGKNEANKFDDYYSSTKKLYAQKFGQPPPADIWPNNDIRFSDIDFQRVNLKSYWLLRRPQFSKRYLLLFFLALGGLMLIQASGMDLLTSVMIGGGVVLAVVIIRNIINGGSDKGGSGCSTPAGCTSTSDSHGHHGGSGCSSGCSGCSSSGCSGCGGGGGD